MPIKEIKDGAIILARHIPASEAWKEGLNFFSDNSEYLQVGTWGYDNEKQLLAHTHNAVSREVKWTQEALFIHSGSVRAFIYDLKENPVATWDIGVGDILILLRGGHGYKILEDNTRVLEIKNGPYVGADADRRRL